MARVRRIVLGLCVILLLTAAMSMGAMARVKLEYWSWDPDLHETFTLMAQDFMELHPEIEVEVLTMPWGAYWDRLAVLNAQGTPPDVYNMSIAYTWDYANQDLILNLQPYVDRLDQSKYFMEAMNELRYPTPAGDLYAFPFGWIASLVFYNRQIFDRYGVPYPDSNWDWFELRDIAKRLTHDSDGDGEVDIWGFQSTPGYHLLDSVIDSWGGGVLDETRRWSALENPASIDAIQFLVDLIHVDRVAPPLDVPADFLRGEYAMFVSNSILSHYLHLQGNEIDWAVAMVPRGPERRVVYGGPDSVAISKFTEHPDEAWLFVEYITGPNRRADVDFRGRVPIHKDLGLSPEWLEWSGGTQRNFQAVYESAEYLRGAYFGTTQWIQWRTVDMGAAMNEAFLGQTSVQNAVAVASQRINTILQSVTCRVCQ